MKYKIISIILSIFIIIGGFITYKFINNTEEFYLYSEIEDLKTSENHTIVLKNKRNQILNNNDYNFVSSDEEVAIIDEDGNIYAISSGSVTITITSKNNEESIRFDLEVIEGESKYLKFIEENITLKINDNLDLVENNMSYNINKNNIDFTSDNEEIVTVDDRGIITAKKEGKTTITAKVDEITTTCEITIIKDEIKATKITLNKKNLTLDKGQTEQLKLTIEPNNTTEREILWISSDTKIVTVNNSGTIIAKKEGKATITAKVGSITTTCEITVIKRDIKVEKLTLNKTAISLKIGQTEQLKLTIEPSNATEKNVTWTSSNETIATVDDRGIITAKKEGNAKITAKVGNLTTTCEITVVKNEIKATKLILNKTAVSLKTGQTEQLQVAIEPSNATEKNVTWTSSDETIATVNSRGTITAKKEGMATITAKVGSITTTCEVTITKSYITVTKLTLNKTKLSLEKGQTEQLQVALEPSNATEKNITWTSSDETIATVNSSGIVTAKKEGKATITAKVGSITTTCEVTITKSYITVTKLTLNKTKLSLEKGQTEQLQVAIEPSNATEKNVTWTSSNETIATVNSSGVITAKKIGKATITAKVGSITTTCEVTIKDTTKPTATPIVKIITVTDNYTITSKNTGHVSEKYYSNDKEVTLNISKSSISGNEDVKYYAYVVAGTQEEALKKEKTVISVSNALNINLSDSNWKVYYIWTVDENGNYSKYYTRIALKYEKILLSFDQYKCITINGNMTNYGQNCKYDKRSGTTYSNYQPEQKKLLNRYLEKKTAQKTTNKRAATLAAVEFLAIEFNTQIRYESNDTYPKIGLNITSDTSCWNCYDPNLDKPRYRGIQCSGFVSWTLVNGGVSYLQDQEGEYINANYLSGFLTPLGFAINHSKTGTHYSSVKDDKLIVSEENIINIKTYKNGIPWDKVKAGDLVGSYNYAKDKETGKYIIVEKTGKIKIDGGHVGIIYKLDSTYVYIAHSADWSGRTNASNGIQITRYKKADFYKNVTFGSSKDGAHIVLMDEVYNK